MNALQLPEYTLRFHKVSVTCLLIIHLSEGIVPLLASGDAKGNICLWDIINRRPKSSYCIENQPQIIALQYIDYGLLAVLDKHHKLRLFKIDSSWEQVYEIPVNTLNFANFLVQKIGTDWYRLVCCNTQDSESLDIYEFHLSSLHSLKRVRRDLKFYQAIRSSTLLDGLKLDRLGIIMKFTEKNGVIYCGMESGFIIGFKLIQENRVKVLYVSHVHYPHPILDLNPDKNCLLSSSTDNKIGIHDLSNHQQDADDDDEMNQDSILFKKHLRSSHLNFKEVPISRISHVKRTEKLLVLSNWAGETMVINDQDEPLVKISKSKSSVRVNENPQQHQKEFAERPFSKVCSLEVLSKSTSENLKDIVYMDAGQKRRTAKFLQENWCIIGYDDGNIAFHRL